MSVSKTDDRGSSPRGPAPQRAIFYGSFLMPCKDIACLTFLLYSSILKVANFGRTLHYIIKINQ